jgi:hypothetical protein
MTTKTYDNEPITKLYDTVKDQGLYTKSFDEFKTKYSNPESISNLYNVVNKAQLYTKSKDEFLSKYFPAPVEKKSQVGGVSPSIGTGEGGLVASEKNNEPFPLTYKRDKEQMVADIRTPEQKTKAKGQAPLAAGFVQVQSPKKDETFKVELTDNEAEQKAIDSFRSGEHSVEPNSQDPVGELASQINIKKYSYPDYKVARKKIEILNDNFFRTGEEAEKYLENNQDKPETNVTKQLATKRYKEYDNVKTALQGSNSLEEAAINYAVNSGNEQVKALLEHSGGTIGGITDQSSAIPQAVKGQLLLSFMMNKDLRQMAENNPDLNRSLKEDMYNFPNHYPEEATKLLAEAIADRRDKNGLNNSFANIVSKTSTDKIVKELIDDGTIPSNYQFLYEKTIRPKLGTAQSIGRGIGNAIPGLNQLVNEGPIPTPGMLENFESGFENAQVSTAKGLVNMQSLLGMPTLTDALQPKGQQLFNILKDQAETPQFEPTSLRQKAAMHGANMAAFVTMLGGGTSVLKAVNLIKNPALASATMMGLSTLGDTRDKAISLFPRNDFKQTLYIDAMTGLNAAIGKYLPGQNIGRLLSKGEGTVADVLSKMVDGKISTSAAKNQIMEWFGDTAKSTLTGGEFMGAISAADDLLTQTLQGKKLNLEQTMEAGWEGAKLGLISTPILGGFEAALKSNKGFRTEILDMAENSEYYKKLAETEAEKNPEFNKIKDDVIKNLTYIGDAYKEFEGADMSTKDKQKSLLNSLAHKIKLDKAELATDPTVKKQYQQEAKDLGERVEASLNGIPEKKVIENQAFDKVKKLYDNEYIPDGDLMMLETESETGKKTFDEKKVKEYLKFIAQQSNNVTEDGKFNEGSDVRKSFIRPKSLVEAANELFPEYKKIAAEADAAKESSSTPMEATTEGAAENVVPSTSVIMPGEIQRPETTTIAPKENVVEPKAKISVILPKNENTKEVAEVPVTAEKESIVDTESNKESGTAGEGTPPISEPPKGGGVFAERPATELSHRGLQDVANEFSLPDVKTRDTKTDVQLRQDARETVNDWAEKGQYGKNVEKLVAKAEDGEVLTDKERVILEGHLANVSQELREMNPKSPEFDAKLAEIKRLKDAGERTRSEAGAALRVPTGGSRPKDIADFLVQEMDAAGVEKLTEHQKETNIKEYESIADAKAKFDEYMAKKEADFAAKQAESEIKKQRATKTQKTKEDFVKERQSLKEKLKSAREEHQQWLKDQGIQKSGFGSFTTKEAKIIGEYIKSYADETLLTLKDLADKVLEEVKDIFPHITQKDIIDVAAGVYNEKKQTKNDLAKRRMDLKIEANLINKLEALERGEEPKSERKKIERNKEITELRDKIKDIDRKKAEEAAKIKSDQKAAEKAKADADKAEDQFIKDFEKEKDTEEKRKAKAKVDEAKKVAADLEKKTKSESVLQSMKTRMEAEIKMLEYKLKTGDFDSEVPTKKKPIVLDEEGKKLKDKLIKLRQDREIRLLQQEYANRNKYQKFGDTALEVLNVPRTVMSSMDFSAPLRQGLIASISHPRTAALAGIEMFRQAGSQKIFDRWFHDLKESKNYELMQESGLYVSDPHDPRLSAKEEAFMNNLAEKIPIAGRLIKGSERAYVGYLNKMRVDLFNRFAERYMEQGKTIENSPELYKKMADYVNNSTGRGKLLKAGKFDLEAAAPILNSTFFSPRLIASRLNLLNPVYYAKLPKEVRIMAAKDMLKFVGLGLTVLGLAKLNGADVEDDPRSSDFGKIKSGDTRWDIWGGFQPYVRVFTQMATGEKKSTMSDEIKKLDGEGAFGENRGDVGARFMRGKLAPVPSILMDFIQGRTITGDKPTIASEAESHLLPLLYSDIKTAMKEKGISSLFTVGLPSAFGVSTQTYGQKKSTGDSKKQTKSQRKDQRKQTKQQ